MCLRFSWLMLRSIGRSCECDGLLASLTTIIFSKITQIHEVDANSVVQVFSYNGVPSLHKEEHLFGKV